MKLPILIAVLIAVLFTAMMIVVAKDQAKPAGPALVSEQKLRGANFCTFGAFIPSPRTATLLRASRTWGTRAARTS